MPFSFRLDVALLVARVRVGERVVEAVVGGEPSEHLAQPDLSAHPPPDLGGVVEDGPRGHAAHELEHVAEPLAHALRRLAPEHLGEPDVGVREADREVPPPRYDAPHSEVRLPEVDLALAGKPAELQVPLRVPGVPLLRHLLAPALHVALHGRVAPAVALLVAQADEDPGGRVPLLPPVAAVVQEPGVDRRLVGLQQLALRDAPPRARGGEVLHPQVLPHRGL